MRISALAATLPLLQNLGESVHLKTRISFLSSKEKIGAECLSDAGSATFT
jgi:hypothetical protein